MRRLREMVRGVSFGLSLVVALFVLPCGFVVALYGRVTHHPWLVGAGVVPFTVAAAYLKAAFPDRPEADAPSRRGRSRVVHQVRRRAITPAALEDMSRALVDGEFWAELASPRLDGDDLYFTIGSARWPQNQLKISCASAPQLSPATPRDRITALTYADESGEVGLRCVDGSCRVPVKRLWVECAVDDPA